MYFIEWFWIAGGCYVFTFSKNQSPKHLTPCQQYPTGLSKDFNDLQSLTRNDYSHIFKPCAHRLPKFSKWKLLAATQPVQCKSFVFVFIYIVR